MNRLEDPGRFPMVVSMGAATDVVVEIFFFCSLHNRVGGRFSVGLVGTVMLAACNFLPVVWLRGREGAAGLPDTPAYQGA